MNRPGPDFLCIGLPKAGTAWLFDQLDEHPDFWMPPLKELHYFDKKLKVKRLENLLRRMQFNRGDLNAARTGRGKRAFGDRDLEFLMKAKMLMGTRRDLQKYAELFESKGDLLTGDITPGYSLLLEDVIQEILQHFPAIKIIFLLRDPIERSWSQLNMQIRQRKLAVQAASDWGEVKSSLSKDGFARVSYPSQVWNRWSKVFPKEQIRYFSFDELCRDPVGFRASILEFLGTDPGKTSGTHSAGFNRKANLRKLDMPESIREHMVEFFRDELLACERMFGPSAKQWLARYRVLRNEAEPRTGEAARSAY